MLDPLDEITEVNKETDSFAKDGFSISISYLGVKKFIEILKSFKKKIKKDKEA